MNRLFRNSVIVILLLGITIYLPSCQKEPTLPVVITKEVSEITETSAKTGGFVKENGGAQIDDLGVCWSTSPNPTTSSDKKSIGTGKGYYTVVINGLMANTTYYVRAYAINSEGIDYGNERSFKTSEQEQGTGVRKSDFPGGSRNNATSFSIGSKVYLGLGTDDFFSPSLRDFWEWDQGSNVWTKKADFGGSGRIGAVGFSIGTKGYIGTGFENTGDNANDLWEYDPETDTWTEKASLPGSAARSYATGFSIGNKGYIVTGFTEDGLEYKPSQDFWEWDQATNVWTKKADFGGSGRVGAVGFSIGEKGYVVTGSTITGDNSNDIWEYDPATDRWTEKASLPASAARTNAVGFTIGTKGYIGTGNGTDGTHVTYLRDFWEWDQSNNIWTRKSSLHGYGRYSAVGVSIGDRGYIGTGAGVDVFRDFWEYDPNHQ